MIVVLHIESPLGGYLMAMGRKESMVRKGDAGDAVELTLAWIKRFTNSSSISASPLLSRSPFGEQHDVRISMYSIWI